MDIMQLSLKAIAGLALLAMVAGCAAQTPSPTPTPPPTQTSMQSPTPTNTSGPAAATSIPAPAGWKLAWSDEFDGPAGAQPDPQKWGYDTGGSGWGNQELEYYTANADNAALDGQGNLLITARRAALDSGLDCWNGPCAYTSARLLTKGKFEFTYGRVEARMRVPFGQGMWPAFWMLGSDIDSSLWPACGEIDIMENIGREPNIVHGTAHGLGYSGAQGIGGPYVLPSKTQGNFGDGFHVFAIEWKPGAIRWYVDGQQYFAASSADVQGRGEWAFNHPFFLLLNLAVGGVWPGAPDATTTFPQSLAVDYVRVYQK